MLNFSFEHTDNLLEFYLAMLPQYYIDFFSYEASMPASQSYLRSEYFLRMAPFSRLSWGCSSSVIKRRAPNELFCWSETKFSCKFEIIPCFILQYFYTILREHDKTTDFNLKKKLPTLIMRQTRLFFKKMRHNL